MKKEETLKSNLPTFAKLTYDKMLQCLLSRYYRMNEVLWPKHAKSEEHIEGLKRMKESLLNKKQKVVKGEIERKI